LAPTLAFLSQISLFFDDKVSRIAAIASSEFMLGDVLSISPAPYAQVISQICTTVFIVQVFLLIAVFFTHLGRFLGHALE
jgi:hypothetical protein